MIYLFLWKSVVENLEPWLHKNLGPDTIIITNTFHFANWQPFDVIKNKKAVCGGYAALLKYFCDGFNIECEVVEGYARLVRIKCT